MNHIIRQDAKGLAQPITLPTQVDGEEVIYGFTPYDLQQFVARIVHRCSSLTNDVRTKQLIEMIAN
jgi:hypothetical protein